MNKQLRIIIFSLLLIPSLAFSQSPLLYYMDDLPQSRQYNYSNLPSYRFTLGLPVVANTELGVYTSSSVNSLFDLSLGSKLVLDVGNVIGKLKKISYVGAEVRTDLLTASFKAFNTYFNLNVSTRFDTEVRIPRSIFELGWYGNGKYIGERADLSGLGYDLKLYNEYGVSATHLFFDKVAIGASFKYLQGLANIYTPANQIGLTTDTTTFWLNADVDAEINVSGPLDTNGININNPMDLLSSKNMGMAFGAGASLKLNDRLEFDINIADVGFIKWNNDTKTFGIHNASFSFEGIEFDTSVFDLNIDSLSTGLLDTLFSTFDIDKTTSKYTSPLRAKLFMSATYNLGTKNRFGFILYNRFGRYSNYTSASLAYHRKFGRWLSAGLSYTIDNLGDSRIGTGLNLKILGMQYYLMTDDLFSLRKPLNARSISLRFGANIMIKAKKDD